MKISNYHLPQPSSELKTLLFLNLRMNLSAKERGRLDNLTKVLTGELLFYFLLKEYVAKSSLHLFDLRLEVNKSEFQIDSLLIFEQKIYLIEVKNYDGDFVWRDEAWHSITYGKDIQNPLQQIQRAELLLKDTLRQLGIHLPIESYVVFINPKFTLYHAPHHQKIVFPGQLYRFISMLNSTPSSLSKRHHEISKELARRGIVTSPHERLPEYNQQMLRKGLMCHECGGILRQLNRLTFKCGTCKKEVPKDSAILRVIYEFHLLFPEMKITVNAIYEWCNKVISKKVIRSVLTKNLEMVHRAKYSYYQYSSSSTPFIFPFMYDEIQKKAIRFYESLTLN